MEIDNFRGVYSSRETDRTAQTPGAARTRKRYWLVWGDTDDTVIVQPLSASLEPAGVKRIIPAEDLETMYTEEPSVVPSFSQPHLTEPDGWERITASPSPAPAEEESMSGDDFMRLSREVRRQAIDLDDTGFLSGLLDDGEAKPATRSAPRTASESAAEEGTPVATGRDARRQAAAPATPAFAAATATGAAEPVSDEATAEKERELRAIFGMALMEFKRGNRGKAIGMFEGLVEEDGLAAAHKHVFTDFGISLRKSKLLDMALIHHLKAAELGRNDEHAHHNVARIYYELGDIDNALRYLHRSLELNPSLVPSERFLRFIRKQRRVDRAPKLDM
ncbi:MAG: tetratricopeptide repeat protein [Halodesulfovibrio sp.]